MVLSVLESARAVEVGDQVVTSQLSLSFPRGLPVGEIVEASRPQGQTLTAAVRPFTDTDRLEAVVVIAWPPDPAAVAADAPLEESGTEAPDDPAAIIEEDDG
jgi:cell shape-determining protein MreC